MALDWRWLRRFWQDKQDYFLLAIALLVFTGTLLEGRRRGYFEPIELYAYDQMVRHQPPLPSDDRLVLVEINEEDLRQQQAWPFPDEAYAQVLEKLQAGNPTAIALDIYRDFPVEPGYERLVKQLKQPNVIAIRNLDILTGTPAPASVAPEQIGFNDVILDNDGILRRALIYAVGSDGMALPSLPLNLAMLYLYRQAEIVPENSALHPDWLQLGQATFVPLASNSGGYQKADTRGYQMLFQYRDHQTIGQTLSFTEVILGNFDPALVQDKIVLIGSTAPSLKDEKMTPFTSGGQAGTKMNGVVVHGQILSYILDTALGTRSQFKFWQEWQEYLWTLGWLAAGAGIGWIFRHPVIIVGSVLGGTVGLVAIGYVLLGQFVWIPVAAPLMSFVLAMGLVIMYQSYLDFRQQKMVMTLLGQNLSPAIANALWEDRSELLTSGNLSGRALTATMLFLDIRGFSGIAESMAPADLMIWLNTLFAMVTAEVQQHQGIVNKFTGDGIIALFGVPVPRQNEVEIAQDAQDAVAAAVAIAHQLDGINQSFQAKNQPLVKMRIGLFTGAVVAGSLGGKDRLEYGVIGDSVNIASRLESCAKERHPVPCRILIAQATAQYLGDRFAIESWGPMPLKGKSEVINVYRVLTPGEPGFLGEVS